MKKNNKIYVIYSFLISVFSISIVDKVFQNDTFSTIKIGDYILKHGIDFVEHFNISNNLYYHNARWLFNIIIAFIYNHFNYIGIYIFVMILSIILGLTIFNVLIKFKNNIFLSFVTTIFTMVSMSFYITARAQTVSYIFLLLEVYFIEKLIETKKKRYILFMLIGSILTANIHTTIWPMTLVLFLPYFAEYILSHFKIFNKQKVFYSTTPEIKYLFISFLIILFSGLCTPLSLTPYTYMFKTMSGLSTKFIAELQPTVFLNNYYFFYYFAFFVILTLYFKARIKVSDLFMFGGLFFMSVMARRNCAFLFLISPIIITRLINNALLNKKENFEKILNFFIKEKIMLIITIIFIFILSFLLFQPNMLVDYVDKTTYPVEASDYIMENIDVENMRLFNGFTYGAYLEFRGMKVFLDSRSEVYCEEFNNTKILEDWYETVDMKVYYKEIFDKYDFTHIMIEKRELLYNYIKHDKDYKKIYEDKYFVLYEKVK